MEGDVATDLARRSWLPPEPPDACAGACRAVRLRDRPALRPVLQQRRLQPRALLLCRRGRVAKAVRCSPSGGPMLLNQSAC